MNRKTKRAKRMRRQQHQAATTTVKRGTPPRERPDTWIRQRQQMVSLCDRLGFKLEDKQLNNLMELLEQGKTTTTEIADSLVKEMRWRRVAEEATKYRGEPSRETLQQAMETSLDEAKFGFSATENGERVNPASLIGGKVKELDQAFAADGLISSEGYIRLDVLVAGEEHQVELPAAHGGSYTVNLAGKTSDPIPYTATLKEAQEIASKVGINITAMMLPPSPDEIIDIGHDESSPADHIALGQEDLEVWDGTLGGGLVTSDTRLGSFTTDENGEGYHIADHPTDDEWEQIISTAKAKKKGVKIFAERAGYTLSDSANPKVRESWVRA